MRVCMRARARAHALLRAHARARACVRHHKLPSACRARWGRVRLRQCPHFMRMCIAIRKGIRADMCMATGVATVTWFVCTWLQAACTRTQRACRADNAVGTMWHRRHAWLCVNVHTDRGGRVPSSFRRSSSLVAWTCEHGQRAVCLGTYEWRRPRGRKGIGPCRSPVPDWPPKITELTWTRASIAAIVARRRVPGLRLSQSLATNVARDSLVLL